jgi:hypothetical protein
MPFELCKREFWHYPTSIAADAPFGAISAAAMALFTRWALTSALQRNARPRHG